MVQSYFKKRDLEIIKSEQITKKHHKWFRIEKTLYTLSDNSEILYIEQAGMGEAKGSGELSLQVDSLIGFLMIFLYQYLLVIVVTIQ